jgi:hypothetical protein
MVAILDSQSTKIVEDNRKTIQTSFLSKRSVVAAMLFSAIRVK